MDQGTLELALEKEAEAREKLELRVSKLESSPLPFNDSSIAELEGAKGEVTRLTEVVARLESEEHEKAILKSYLGSADKYLELGQKLGFNVLFEEAPEAEVAEVEGEGEGEGEPETKSEDKEPEAEAKVEEEAEAEEAKVEPPDPNKYEIRQGKVNEPGWDYLELFNISIREKVKE